MKHGVAVHHHHVNKSCACVVLRTPWQKGVIYKYKYQAVYRSTMKNFFPELLHAALRTQQCTVQQQRRRYSLSLELNSEYASNHSV